MKLAESMVASTIEHNLVQLPRIAVVLILLSATVFVPDSLYGAPLNRQQEAAGMRRAKKAKLPPRGIIIYKFHVQADEHAPFVEYSSLKVIAKTAIDIVKHDDGRLVSIPKRQLVYHVVYPQETVELVSDFQIEKLRERLDKLREVAERYYQTSSRLLPWIVRLEHEVTMWDDGFCRIDGKWVNRYEQRVAELRSAFAKRRAQILDSPVADPSDYQDREERPLPPMWTLDFEQQLKEEEAALRDAQKRKEETAKLRRSQDFHDKVEEERPFRTGWRLEKEPLP